MAIVRGRDVQIVTSVKTCLLKERSFNFYPVSSFSDQPRKYCIVSSCVTSRRKYCSFQNNRKYSSRYRQSLLGSSFRPKTSNILTSGVRGYQTLEWRRNVHAQPKTDPKWTPGTIPHM